MLAMDSSSLSDFFSRVTPLRNWLEFPEVPLANEFMASDPPRLPLNDFEARAQLRDQYFETQYRLLRYEVTETLRRAVETIRKASKASQIGTIPYEEEDPVAPGTLAKVNVYKNVRITGYALGRDGAGQRVVVPDAPVRDPDEEDEDDSDDIELFCPGSLVILSRDLFKSTCYVATVMENDGLRDQPPTIDIIWATKDYMMTDPTVDLVMLEPTSGYFESSRHTMLGLQQMSQTSSLLNPYLFQSGPHSVPSIQYLKETPNGDPVVPKSARSLDTTQHVAFTEAVTQEISIIQGPPGTGKTFTSNVILQSVVQTQRQCHEAQINPGQPRIPIIVAAQTNHALDQLLEKYKEAEDSGKIVRLGSRSNSEEISKLILPKLMRDHVPGFHRQSMKTLHSTLKQTIIALREAHTLGNDVLDAKELLEHKVLSEDQYFSITEDDWESADCAGGDFAEWLGQPQHRHNLASGSLDTKARAHVSIEAYRSKLEPRWQSSGLKFIPFDIQRQDGKRSAYSREAAIYQLAHNRNLYNIKLEDRSTVYNYLRDSLRAIKSPAIPDLLQTYDDTRASMRNVQVTNRIAFIQAAGIEVIGCTATGLLKYRELIASLRPKILLMEEAAEIREGDTIAAVLPSIEHLILLGDHQQLQPHVDLPELARDPYRVNISMFERLIKLGIPHQILLQQRRMIPCLREIVQLFYPRLVDHTSTISKLPLSIPGVSTPLWWFQHDWPESPGIGNSAQNFTEALMIVRFVQYLVTRANISPTRITLLTYYRGQVDILNKLLASNQWLVACETEWAVRTVDGFQGEENDIILLSLVRGPNGKAGFLTQENRAIVGLSRARVGMYIFGHRDVLTKHPVRGETWSKVVRQMKGKQGRALPLCPNMDTEVVHVDHPGQLKRIIRDPQYRKDSSTHSSGGPDSEKQPLAAQAAEVKRDRGSDRENAAHSAQVKLPFRIEADRPASSPPGQRLDHREDLASDLKLFSFEDFETIPLSAPDCPWDRPPLMPTITPMKEDLLLEFSDDEVSAAGTDDS